MEHIPIRTFAIKSSTYGNAVIPWCEEILRLLMWGKFHVGAIDQKSTIEHVLHGCKSHRLLRSIVYQFVSLSEGDMLENAVRIAFDMKNVLTVPFSSRHYLVMCYEEIQQLVREMQSDRGATIKIE